MSLDFIKIGVGSSDVALAARQQEQLAYLTQSAIQEDISEDYLKAWVERKFHTNDYFLNWVKTIFRTENFLAFYKYFRNPLASASLVNDEMKNNLMRVFHAEDSYFKYHIKGKEVHTPPELDSLSFQDELFNALLFQHNDILVHDLRDVNTPYREFVPIKNVVAIESENNTIHKLCYQAQVVIEEKLVKGKLYMDAERYCFYEEDRELLNVPHDLGICPATYISMERFTSDVVRKSIFSYVRESFEQYIFLKTLQRMVDANGTIPITVEMKVNALNKDGKAEDGPEGMPMSAQEITSQRPELGRNNAAPINGNTLQAGTRIVVPPIKDKSTGEYNFDLMKNIIHFHYAPVEALEYLQKRISEVKKNILIAVLGDYSEANEAAKNELQVAKSYENKQDKLRALALNLSWVRNRSDYIMLALMHGRNAVSVDCFYGSDFFLESQEDLYNLLNKAPNIIERKSILVRASQNRNKFNPHKAAREKILYQLIPYISDSDFEKAIDRNLVDDVTFQYQNRFDYWIALFEASYGDIVIFWETLGDNKDSEKLLTINNLIINLIQKNYEQINSKADSTSQGVQGQRAK